MLNIVNVFTFQDLQARLTEEISRMRSVVMGQGSEGVSHDNQDRPSCELEVGQEEGRRQVVESTSTITSLSTYNNDIGGTCLMFE